MEIKSCRPKPHQYIVWDIKPGDTIPLFDVNGFNPFVYLQNGYHYLIETMRSQGTQVNYGDYIVCSDSRGYQVLTPSQFKSLYEES
jgi:hypothetical protein